MRYQDLINLKDKITLEGVKELGRNSVEVTINFYASPKTEPVQRKIFFDTYVSYTVLNESYTYNVDGEVYDGNLCRIYSESHYLEYIKKITLTEDLHPETQMIHYELVCEDHIVDIISLEEPDII